MSQPTTTDLNDDAEVLETSEQEARGAFDRTRLEFVVADEVAYLYRSLDSEECVAELTARGLNDGAVGYVWCDERGQFGELTLDATVGSVPVSQGGGAPGDEAPDQPSVTNGNIPKGAQCFFVIGGGLAYVYVPSVSTDKYCFVLKADDYLLSYEDGDTGDALTDGNGWVVVLDNTSRSGTASTATHEEWPAALSEPALRPVEPTPEPWTTAPERVYGFLNEHLNRRAQEFAQLCKASGTSMPFVVTTNWMVFGDLVGESRSVVDDYLRPAALSGTVTFTGGRSGPVFTVDILTDPQPPADYPISLWGSGGNQALSWLKSTVHHFAQSEHYPYRDGAKAIIVEGTSPPTAATDDAQEAGLGNERGASAAWGGDHVREEPIPKQKEKYADDEDSDASSDDDDYPAGHAAPRQVRVTSVRLDNERFPEGPEPAPADDLPDPRYESAAKDAERARLRVKRHAEQQLRERIDAHNTGVLGDLCAAADSDRRVAFLATSAWLALDPDAYDELRDYKSPDVLRGLLRFTRNRTRPNVFSFEEVTGPGGTQALRWAEQTVMHMVQDPAIYRYRDRERVKFDPDLLGQSSAAVDAARAPRSGTPRSFQDLWENYKGTAIWTAFRAHIEAEQAAENVDFLTAVDRYRVSPSKRDQKEIIWRFLRNGADQWINLEPSIGTAILNAPIDGRRDVFDKAAANIMALVESEAYLRFRLSRS